MLNVSNTIGAASLLILFQSANVPLAHSDERHVVLTNNTHELIIEIYVSDDRTDNWQEDHLGSEFLVPGNSPLRSMIATAIVGLTLRRFSATGPVSSTVASMLASPMATQFYSDKQK